MSIFDEYRKKNRKEEEEGSVENSLASFRDQNDRTKSLFQDKGYAEVTSNARAQINTSDSIRKFRENNIAQRDYEIAEREYMASLPNDAYRDAYTRSKENEGVYVSPYFKTGTEGKEKLQYNNPEWNRLSEGEKKGYLEWAQQELEKESKKTRPNLERDNKYLNYAMSILNETNQTVRTIGDTHNISGNLFRAFVPDKIEDALGMNKESADTFNKDQELQIMLNMMPEEVRQYLNTGMVNLVREGQTLDTAEAIEDYLAKYYPPDVLEKLTKYARKVENIQKQQERNEDTERKMENPFYATVVAPARQIGADLLVKPVAGAVDFVRASSEANKGIYGEFDPLQTEAQRMAQDARYINQSILEGLQYGVDIPFTEDEKLEQFAGNAAQFSYNTSVSAAESAARMYLAGGLAKTMPFLNTETASKVLLTGMMSTAVFNDDLNENIQKGMPLEDAIGSAVAHSVFESLFEEVSLDKLGYFQDAPVLRSKKEFVKALGKAAFVEGSEEAFTDIANELYDHYVGNYDFSEYKAFKDKYLASNPDASDAEVWWNFTKQFSWQVAQSFAGGALSSFALSSTKNMSALHRGEIYVQNGKNVSDADYNRMNAFVEEMAAVNPNIANQLAEANEGGEDARRGFVKMVADEYSNKFNKEIARADSKDKLNVVMNNVNSVMNGAISEDTFNTYNAKLVELGETPADYNTFVQNRQRGGETTFSDLAYGRGDNAIQRNIVEASKSIAETRENANMGESERETAINELRGKIEQNVKKAEDMVARYAQMGKALDSPEVRQFESVLGLENMAQIYSAGKIASENKMLPSVTGRGGKLYAVDKNSEGARAIFGENIDHVQDVPFSELQKTTAYSLGKVLAKMTGVDVAFYKSDRQKVQNGAFHRNSNTIYIDVNAGVSGADAAVGEVFSHELTHWIRSKNEEGYQRLLDFVKADLGDSYDSMLKDHMDRLGLDEDVAGEEIVAEACQRMLKDSETFKRYASADMEGAKTLLQRLVDFVRKLRDAFKGSLNNEATRMIQNLEGLQQTWETALQEAIGEQTAMEGGIDVETFDDTAVRDSIRTVLDEKQQERVSKMLQDKLGVDKKTADDYIENEQTIASLIFDNIGFLDYKPDDRYEAIKKNSDYPQGTVDMTNLCRKRAIFTQIFDSLQEHFPNRLFNAMDIADIREVLKTNGYQVACALCFVEDRRQRVGEIAENFIERLKESNGKTLTVVNSKGETKELFMTKDLANTDVARRAGFKYKDAIKVTDKYIPNQYDLVTYEGFKALSENHPQVAVAFTRANNYLGMSSARLVEGRAEYKRDILKYTPTQVKRINNKGGLRIFSFSDFEAVHLLDICQVIMDASAVGLKIQAYTKVPAFAKLVANTGIKLNRSLIASGKGFKVNPDGSRTLTYDTHEGIDIDDKDFFDSSDNPNIGNILVGISDEHIRLAMLDDFVDYIIPFHSNQGKNVLAVKGISHWTNYKEYQRERYADGRKGARDVNIYTQVIDKYHPTNKVEFVEAFLKECKAQGKIPRFDQFLNKVNGEYVYTPGYEKLLLDFKLFDKQGNILPQNTVNPNIDMEVATRILNDEVKGAEKREQVSGKIIKELEKKYEVRNSSRDSERIAEESLENANDDEKEILSGNDIRYSQRVTDQKTLDFLNNQEYITTYRSFQLINGGLYSPMNQGREGYKTELDVWEQSTEITDFDEAVRNKVLVPQKNGGYKYNLKSGNNTTSGKNRTTAAAYNPYLHSSNSVMNDQFSAAYDRPNLVVVECRVPKSEASRPYKAKNATDPVGWKEWKSGKASTELAKNGGEARGVFLSRWMKAVRILPYSEVAQMYKDALEGTDITIAWNVVPPGLRQELERIGVPIDYSYKNGNVTFENMFPDEAYKANGVRNSSRDSERDSEYMAAVNSGDMDTAQRLVDEAAKEAGYTEEYYHGSHAKFNSFDLDKSKFGNSGYGIYLGGRMVAAEFGGDDIIRLYVNPDRIARSDTHSVTTRQFQSALKRLGLSAKDTYKWYVDSASEYVSKRDDWRLAYDLQDWAKQKKKLSPSEILSILQEELNLDGMQNRRELVLWDNKLLKSADPVTYDDNGNVIPLSERFNKESEDIRYSSRDSSGRELTEAQQEYFKDSKIRDDKGNLKVMFHGTEADFNIFDFSQGGKNGTAEGFGIYLTDNEAVAKAYGGRIIKSYVNVTKPARFDKKTITPAKLVKLIETTARDQAQRMIEEEGYGSINDAIKDTWISNYTYTYDKSLPASYREVANSIIRMSDNDRDIVQEVMSGMAIRDYDAAVKFYDVLQDVLGIDGFITEWKNRETGEKSEIVLAFNSNQIKNIDNLNPTENEDIRFSTRDSEGHELTEAQQEYFADSKVRDENGNLMVVYHGTDAEFTVFEPNEYIEEENGLTRIKGYFSENEEYSKNYGRTKPFYLNITNPLVSTDTRSRTLSEWVEWFESKGVKGVRFDSAIADDPLKGGKYPEGTYYTWWELLDYGNYWNGDGNVTEKIEEAGYDGITWEEDGRAWMPFNRNAIKSVDNANPTESDDIRYSLRDLANSESEIIVNALANDEALVESIGAREAVETYTREYKKLTDMEATATQITKDLKKKGKTPIEREKLLHKLVRIERAISDRTATLSEMRNSAALRTLLESEWEKRDAMVSVGKADERLVPKKLLEEKYGAALEEWTENRKRSAERNKAKQTEIRNRFEINKRKKNIETKAKSLMKMILNPTEKKHIPSVLVNPITDLLDSIDYWTPAEGRPITKKSESLRTRFEDFRSAINEYQKQIDDGAEQIELMFDPEFLETVDDLCNSVKGIDNVNDMSVQDIIDLDHTLTELLHLISRGNKMIKAYHYETIKDAVDATAETMDKLDTLSSKTSAKGNLRMRLNAGMADSYAFGRYAGDGTKQIIDSLSKAFEEKIGKVKQAIEFTQEVIAPYKKDLKKWSKDTHEFTLSTTDEKGNPNKVSLTVGQMMELYLLNKREQARGHIYGGGIRVEDRKGRYTESVKVTEEDVQEIVNYLATVPGAIEVADKLQKYGATTITGWGNEASNLMYGFAKFTEPDYWQIRSDSSALKDNENTEAALNASMYRLQNMGRTKAVKKGANNAIYVGDVFDTWSKTIDEMTSYASILPSTTDAMRWWNSRIVNESGDAVRIKKLLESKLGTDMTRVFTETIKALNGGIMGTDSLESLVKVLTGKAKAAAVAGNLRVVLQQPTAYTRAAAVIEPKYLLKALKMKPNAKEAQEHSAIAWHKAQGFYSNGLAPSLRKLVIGDGSFGENLTEKSLWLAGKADDITWGALWNASKLKVEDENKALKNGSDEYWEEVNKVFSDIINNTQVVDTPLTKSTWMRGNGLGVFFTAFMAEPTKTYSMVMTAVEDLVRNPKSKQAQKTVALVGTVFAVNAAVNALAQALADAARDDDKEKSYWEKYVEKYTEDIKDNLNPLTYIPVVKDIFSLWNGYSNNNLAMQAAQNTVYAVQELQKIAKGTSKKTLFGQMETCAKAVSSWTGIPFGNVMRTFNSFGNIVGIDTFRRKKYTKSELGRNVVLSIKEGNTAEATEYWNQLVREVGEDEISEAYGYISTYLAEHDDNVDAYAVAFLEDANNLETQAEDLMRKYEYNEYITLDVATDAIRKAARADQKAEAEAKGEKYKQTVSSTNSGGTIYNSSDVNRALERGNIDEAQKVIDKINAGYKTQGSNSTAKSAVSNYWKPKYLSATGAERDRIARMLYKLKNNGKQMFSSKDLQKWVSDANKSKK